MDRGIDYSLGQANFNPETGIHFGVIPMNSLASWAWESFEADYGDPHCPKCGNAAVGGDSDISAESLEARGIDSDAFDGDRGDFDYEVLHHACGDYACDYCHILFDGQDAFGDEAIGHTLDDGEYKATVGSDCIDAFVLSSPYYTKSQYCSPCAPGAGYLLNPVEDGVKSYCFGQDWFDDEQPCPYPIWRCDTDDQVYTPSETD